MPRTRGGNGLDLFREQRPGCPQHVTAQARTSRREGDLVETPTPGEFGFYFDFYSNPRKFLAGRGWA